MWKQAMILAAGRGTRLRPATDVCPKALVPVCGRPLIDYHLERLAVMGCERVVINTGWLGDQLEAYVGDGRRWGVTVMYSRESREEGYVLGTAGGIRYALDQGLLSDDVFGVINGDVWTDWPIQESSLSLLSDPLGEAHLILVPQGASPRDFCLTEAGWVCRREMNDYTFSGIAVYRKRFFLVSPEFFSLGDMIRARLDQQCVSGSLYTGVWIDMGTEERIQKIDPTFLCKSFFNDRSS